YADIPAWAFDSDDSSLVSITRTSTELSVVCPSRMLTGNTSDTAQTEPGWRVLTVQGPLAFTLTGILAAVSSELAAAGVTLFSLSTFDTDHVLVKAVDLDRAVAALHAAGHEVIGT